MRPAKAATGIVLACGLMGVAALLLQSQAPQPVLPPAPGVVSTAVDSISRAESGNVAPSAADEAAPKAALPDSPPSTQLSPYSVPFGPERLAKIRHDLFAEPQNTWLIFEALMELIRDPRYEEEAMQLLLDVRDAFPDSTSPSLALAILHRERGESELAIPYLEAIQSSADQPERVLEMLVLSRLDISDFEAAVTDAKQMNEIYKGEAKRAVNDDEFTGSLKSGKLRHACIFEAFAHVRQDRVEQGKAVLRHCFDDLGVLVDDAAHQKNFLEQLANRLEDWRDQTLEEVMKSAGEAG